MTFRRTYKGSFSINGWIEHLIVTSACHNNLVGLTFRPVTHDRKLWASILLDTPFPRLKMLSMTSRIFPSDSGYFPSQVQTFGKRCNWEEMQGVYNTPEPHEHLSWEGLQSLKCLNHLHIDASSALMYDEYDKFRTMIPDILSHLPPSVVYVSINLSLRLLEMLARFESYQRQFCADLISGRFDNRIVICYWSAGRTQSFPEKFSKTIFSKYLLPQMPVDSVYMIAPAAEFWENVEMLMLRRNRRLKMGMGTSNIHVHSLE
ncbi:hypothetical protein Agabi119p4_6438 [Agaricus bisporus var. burnettii]|uniref:Uncharacterized protein n=1 Tax=Agaricus bisporus var. burnettii TaxID=192524 RepID=A0A8H7C9U1_AGABI|nr:hypothetical protein Agabi119p4_6438 [Agaricus bisporus var. burnettii]